MKAFVLLARDLRLFILTSHMFSCGMFGLYTILSFSALLGQSPNFALYLFLDCLIKRRYFRQSSPTFFCLLIGQSSQFKFHKKNSFFFSLFVIQECKLFYYCEYYDGRNNLIKNSLLVSLWNLQITKKT